VTRALSLLDETRQIEAVHARHHDVQHNGGEVVVEKSQQRFVGRLGADQPAPARRKDRLECREVAYLVIDEQDPNQLVLVSLVALHSSFLTQRSSVLA
jgi:hypothetical protein